MKPLLITLTLLCAMAGRAHADYVPNLDRDTEIMNLSIELMLHDGLVTSESHKLVESLRREIGMPDQGSDQANIFKFCDYNGKTIQFQHNFKSWQELEMFEANGCSFLFTNFPVQFIGEVTNFICYTTNLLPETFTNVRLDEVTNWTGYNFQGRELGYVATNHVAVIQYQGATNEFVLKCVASEKAVWRTNPPPMWNGIWITNYPITTNIWMNIKAMPL